MYRRRGRRDRRRPAKIGVKRTMTDTPTTTSEYERERREKLQRLRDLGVDPFGQRTENVKPLAEIRALHKPEFGQDGGPSVIAAGRVMFKKSFGKLSFVTLRDDSGDL